MVWFAVFACVVLEILAFENHEKLWKMLSQQFFMIFKCQYFGNHTCKHSKPYHFFEQFFMLFLLVAFIFAFEYPEKSVFLGYEDRQWGGAKGRGNGLIGLRAKMNTIWVGVYLCAISDLYSNLKYYTIFWR